MAKVVYSMGVSVDGFIAGPEGEIDWSAPDDELHRFHNEQARELGAHFLGRRLYETMLYWETAESQSGISETEREFARIWQALPKVVFSRTLERVEGNARLATQGVAEEVAELKARSGKDIGVGGAALASSFIELGLVDEFRLFLHPAVVGGGTPFFPMLEERVGLELMGTRTFGSQVLYARYRTLPTERSRSSSEHPSVEAERLAQPGSGGRRSVTSKPCSAASRAAISERWQASGSRSTQSRAAWLPPIQRPTSSRSARSRTCSV